MTRSTFVNVDCAVAQAVEQLGDQWTLLILRSAFHGIRRFDEFREHLNIAENILTTRLAKLVKAGIFQRTQLSQDKRVYEYRLTEKGYDTYALVVFLNQWGERWMGKPEGERVEIVETISGRKVQDVRVLSTEGRVLNPRDTTMQHGAGRSAVLDLSRNILARRRGPSGRSASDRH